jgi:serine/threonine-protein kinase
VSEAAAASSKAIDPRRRRGILIAVQRGHDLSGVVLDGRYKIVQALAEGAMGAVYRGERVGLGREVAIKVMHEVLPGELSARERFDREAQLMAKLTHPHCVSVIDYGVHEGKPYLVMELVRGKSLFELINAEGTLPVRRAADIVRQILAGLAHAHELGIVHRDIKPANVMVSPKEALGDHVQILDFGLARLREHSTQLTAGIAVGTPSYMAPEQCRGAPADARVDIYACGVVLFEMIAGRKPFVSQDPLEVVRKHLNDPPPRLADVLPGDHGELEEIVRIALAKQARDRYQTSVEMAAAIELAVPTARPASGGGAVAELPMIGSSAILAVEEPSAAAPPPAHEPAREPPAREPPARERASAASLHAEAMLEPSSLRARVEVAPDGPAPSRPMRSRALDPHEASMLRRMLPRSRMKWAALFILLLVIGGIYGIVRAKQYLSEETQLQHEPEHK